MDYGFYIQAANRIASALEVRDNALKPSLARALREGCRMLERLETDLAPDGDMAWVFRHAADLKGDPNAGFDDLTNALVMWQSEEKALREAGLNEPAMRRLREGFVAIHAQLGDDSPDPERTRRLVGSVRFGVCSEAFDREHIDQMRRAAAGCALIAGGAAVVLVDGSVEAITVFGLTIAVTKKSIQAGSKLIIRGARDIAVALGIPLTDS